MAPINLNIKIGVSPTAPQYTLTVPSETTTLYELKTAIALKQEVDKARIRLVCKGREFFADQEEHSLATLSITEGTTVVVVISVKKAKEEEKMDEDVADEEDEEETQDILLECADIRFALTTVGADSAALKKQLQEILVKNNMSSLMSVIWEENKWAVDAEVKRKMDEAIKNKLEELEKKKKDMEENAGDVEVRDVDIERAKFVALTHSKDEAIAEWVKVEGVTKGKDIDRHLSILRIALAYGDDTVFKKYQEPTKKLIDDHGDWDRRNRFFVYEAMHFIRVRNFSGAAANFKKAIATFSANEICTYKDFVFYTCITSIVSVERVEFKKNIMNKPEVLTVVDEIPNLRALMQTLVDCRYAEFFHRLADMMGPIRKDRYLHTHASWFIREIRLIAYKQFATAYQSVALETMAREFGVSVPFLDREISSYVAAGRLPCKIDKIAGVVETMKADKRNTQYADMLKKGDLLLSRIQMLTKVITV